MHRPLLLVPSLLLISMPVFGQSVSSDSQTLQSLLAEVAYQRHPDRFVRSAPKPPALPSEVWINKPVSSPEALPVGEGDETAAIHFGKAKCVWGGQKRGCYGSTQWAIVVARRSWQAISWWETQQMKKLTKFHEHLSQSRRHAPVPLHWKSIAKHKRVFHYQSSLSFLICSLMSDWRNHTVKSSSAMSLD
jgi:hypothetical protein